MKRRKAPASGRARRAPSGALVLFPPLGRVPPPPRARPDTRQTGLARTMAALLGSLGHSDDVRSTNVVTGFRASAVDVGALKAILEAGLAAFDMKQMKTRWKQDVLAWMVATTRVWAQRCKLVRMRLRDEGIRVELQTQDDEGYYDYGFDVFPGSRRRRRRSRPSN